MPNGVKSEDDAKYLPPRDDTEDHKRAVDSTVVFLCANGHRFGLRVGRKDYGDCSHGLIWDEGKQKHVPVQVELYCATPGCGARLSVVGEVGRKGCPRCGSQMICSKCAASVADGEGDDSVACPQCGTSSVSVESAPPVVFGGVIRKTITAGGNTHATQAPEGSHAAKVRTKAAPGRGRRPARSARHRRAH